MKLHKSLLLFGAGAMLLTACGNDGGSEETSGTEEPTTEEAAEETDESTESEETTETEETNDELYEFNEVVAENEKYKITLLNIEHVYDELLDEEKTEIRYDVENLSDIDIVVQSPTVSLNDQVIVEPVIMMSQEVAAGKSADAILEILHEEGNELPALEGNLEMTLHIFDWDYTFDDDVLVSIELD